MSDNRRRHGRLRCRDLKCVSVGDVVDISASGMKLTCPRSLPVDAGAKLALRITDGDTLLEVCCRVVHIGRAGFFRRTLGLEFIDLDDDVRSQLNYLARSLAKDSINPMDRAGDLVNARLGSAAR